MTKYKRPYNEILENKWLENYELAKSYFDTYRNLKVPRNYIINGVRLGLWLNRQKSNYRLGCLDRDRVLLLEKIQIDWGLTNEEQWILGYKHAKDYYNTYSNLLVPFDYICEDNYKLGIWLINQRRRLKEESKISLLNDIGMIWKDPISDNERWNIGYIHAKHYLDTYHNLLVPYNFVCQDGFRLGCWVHNQRSNYKKNILNKNKVQLLNKLNFVWRVK